MLGRAIIFLLALTALGHAAGPPRSPEKLRSLAMVPSINLQLDTIPSLQVDSIANLHTNDFPARIAALRKQMQNDPSDAERQTLLGRYLDALNLQTEATVAFSNALRYYRVRAEAKLKDGALQAKFISALRGFDEAEADRVARATIRAIPDGWHSWAALGDVHDAKVRRILFGFPEKRSADEMIKYTSELSRKLQTPFTREETEALDQHATEADQCFDRAVALGAKEPEPYLRRAGHRLESEISLQTLGKARGWQRPARAKLFMGAVMSSPEICADLEKAIRMAPTNAGAIGTWGMVEAAPNLETEKPMESLPAPRRKNVLEAIRLLEKLGDGADPQSAALALESVGILQVMVTREPTAARTAFRRAVTLDPLRTQAWDGLLLLTRDAEAERLAICEERSKQEGTVRSRVIAAIGQDRAKQYDKALAHAQAAVKLDPQSALAQVCLGAIMLRRSTDIPALLGQNDKADELITRLGTDPGREKLYYPNFINRCILAALAGQPEETRKGLKQLLDSKNVEEDFKERAREILALIGEQ